MVNNRKESMSRNTGNYKAGAFRGETVQGEASVGYSPMKATNFNTGQLQDVILMSPNHLEQLPSLAVEGNPELRADLNRAFSQFNRVEQRILFRVLVEGQTLSSAVRRMSKSITYYHIWLHKVALPRLRVALRDYTRYQLTPEVSDRGTIVFTTKTKLVLR
jgi:hypothetical protein